MAEGRCNFCGKLLDPNEQVAALNERAIKALQLNNPDMYIGPSNATDPAGNRRWVICLHCSRKYGLSLR